MHSRISRKMFVEYRMAKLVAASDDEIAELCSLNEQEVKEIERRYHELRKRYNYLFT